MGVPACRAGHWVGYMKMLPRRAPYERVQDEDPSLSLVCARGLFPAGLRALRCGLCGWQKPTLRLAFVCPCRDCQLPARTLPSVPVALWVWAFSWLGGGALALVSRSGYRMVLLVSGYTHVGGCCQLTGSKSGKRSLLRARSC